MTRRPLDQRRETDSFEFEWNGVHYHTGISRFEDGQIAEIFLDAGKAGSAVNIMAKDASVVFSIARQFGVPLKTMLGALSQELDGRYIGPLGVALALADAEDRSAVLLTLVPSS